MIGEIIRGEIGFDGVLISDDLSMRALGGALSERVRAGARTPGCDLVLHCNGDRGEMEEVVAAATPSDPGGGGAAGARRGDAPRGPANSIAQEAERRFDALLGEATR